MSVALVRYLPPGVGGAICGLGGAYLSIGQNAQFVPLMSAGKDYIAQAVLVFARWRPLPILLIALGFDFLDAMEARLQGVTLPYIGVLPVQLVQARLLQQLRKFEGETVRIPASWRRKGW